MHVIVPHPISLISSSIEEQDAPTWSASTTYTTGQKVIYDHAIYESLKSDNAAKTPSAYADGITAWWRKIGATNRWACFDSFVSTQTMAKAETMHMEVAFDRATAFAVLNTKSSSFTAQVTARGESTPYHKKDYELIKDTLGRSRHAYRYMPREYVKDVVDTTIGLVPKGTIRFEWSMPSATPSVGHIVVGRAFDVGLTDFGATPSIKSYSKIIEDGLGGVTFIPRQTAKKLRCDLYLHPSRLDVVFETLRSLINVPALWIGDNRTTAQGGFESLTLWGYLQEVEMPIKSHSVVAIPIQIMGLI